MPIKSDIFSLLADGTPRLPRTIANTLGANENSVRTELKRGYDSDKILKDRNGFYYMETVESVKKSEPKYENVYVTYQRKEPVGERTEDKTQFLNRNLYVYCEKETINFRVGTDGFPLSKEELLATLYFIKELISKQIGAVTEFKDITIKNIEINMDTERLRLEGLNCLTFQNDYLIFKQYNKKSGLRREIRLYEPITLDEAIEVLKAGPIYKTQLHKNHEAINNVKTEIQEQFKRTNGLILELAKKINKE